MLGLWRFLPQNSMLAPAASARSQREPLAETGGLTRSSAHRRSSIHQLDVVSSGSPAEDLIPLSSAVVRRWSHHPGSAYGPSGGEMRGGAQVQRQNYGDWSRLRPVLAGCVCAIIRVSRLTPAGRPCPPRPAGKGPGQVMSSPASTTYVINLRVFSCCSLCLPGLDRQNNWRSILRRWSPPVCTQIILHMAQHPCSN